MVRLPLLSWASALRAGRQMVVSRVSIPPHTIFLSALISMIHAESCFAHIYCVLLPCHSESHIVTRPETMSISMSLT